MRDLNIIRIYFKTKHGVPLTIARRPEENIRIPKYTQKNV